MTTNQARLPGRRAGRPAPVRRPDPPHSDGPVALPVPDNTIGLDVAVGLLFQAQDQVRRAGDSVGTLARALLPLGRRIARLPLVDTVGRHAATRLDHVRERGTREVEAYRQRVDAMVQQAASAALRSRTMDDIVGEVTTRFATPIVEAQLPVVLERLGERPEVLRPIADQTVRDLRSLPAPARTDRDASRLRVLPQAAPDGQLPSSRSSSGWLGTDRCALRRCPTSGAQRA